MKNYESYETPSERLEAYLNDTKPISPDFIVVLEDYTNWLDEETKEPSELKPCPFCGANAVIDRTDRGFSVRCLECHTESYPQFMKEDAISLWNRRASITPSPD